MSEGSFVGMGGQLGLCAMGSLVSLVKSSRFNTAKKGDWEVDAIAMCEKCKVMVRKRVGLRRTLLCIQLDSRMGRTPLPPRGCGRSGVWYGVGRPTRVPN